MDVARAMRDIRGQVADDTRRTNNFAESTERIYETFQRIRRVVADPEVMPADDKSARRYAQELAGICRENGHAASVPSEQSEDRPSQTAAAWLKAELAV